jgi:hypothetical protein
MRECQRRVNHCGVRSSGGEGGVKDEGVKDEGVKDEGVKDEGWH